MPPRARELEAATPFLFLLSVRRRIGSGGARFQIILLTFSYKEIIMGKRSGE
jgi:hypothetical protein